MTKEEDKSTLNKNFNLWGFVPPHMFYGRADFGSQHSTQLKEEARKREEEYRMMAQHRLTYGIY